MYIGARSNRWYTQAQITMAHDNPPGAIIWQYSNINAAAQYYWATGAPVSVTMRISGTRIWGTNVTSNAVQDVTFTNTNWEPLTGCWKTVTTATNIAGTASSNDYILVGYTNPLTYVSWNTIIVPQRAYWRYFETMRYVLNNLLWTHTTATVQGWTNNWECSDSRAYPAQFGTIQTNINAAYSLDWVYKTGRHFQWAVFSAVLWNEYYNAPPNVRSAKVSGERQVTPITLTTNFAKTCQFYLGAGSPYEIDNGCLDPFSFTNEVYYTWGQPWERYKWNLVWTTNALATEWSLFPCGYTNQLPYGTTFPSSSTNIGGPPPWEVIGLNEEVAGFGFYSVGKWLIKWDVTNGFTYK
jgi:hypothetical protein